MDNSNDIAIKFLREKEAEIERNYKRDIADIRKSINILLGVDRRHIESDGFLDTSAKRKYVKSGYNNTEAAKVIADTIKEANRFLHRAEIENLLGWDANFISVTLSTAKKKRKYDLVSYVPGKSKNQTVWGFKSWLDFLEEVPMKEHMYDEEFVLSRK